MPPAAISRSSTYLPKIWGNTPSKTSALLFALLVSGCGPDREPDVIHTIAARYVCGPGEDETARIVLEALGDFQPSTNTDHEVEDDAKGVDLPFPLDTRGVEAHAELQTQRWTGVGLTKGNDIRVSLWPVDKGCSIWQPSPNENAFPLDAVGTGLGYSPEQRVLLVAGSSYPNGDPRALVIDLDSGVAEQIDDPNTVEFASITPFGADAFLVAGGSDPRDEKEPGDTARVFDIRKRAFEAEVIGLTRVRSRHGAVVLANGNTLLVGGVDNDDSASATLEAVSPTAPRSTAATSKNLTQLFFARVSPTVLRLSDDRIFVGGGRVGPLPDDAPVSALEFLDPEAKKASHVIEKTQVGNVRVGSIHAFAPLPGGGVLAVGLCLSKAKDDDCDADVDQRRSRSYAWVHPDGEIHEFETLLPKLTFVDLVPGGDGMPWLFSRTKTPAQDIWLRFEPWSGGFQIPINAPNSGPAPSPVLDACDCIQTSCESEIAACDLDPDCEKLYDCVESESACGFQRCKSQHAPGVAVFEQTVESCASAKCGPRRLAPPVAIDPGLIVWLEQAQDALGNHPSVVGFRFDTRTIFARQVAPLLASDTLHIAPSVTPFPFDSKSGIRYDAGLVLSRHDVVATVTDTTYADVDITLVISGSLPRVRFGNVLVGDAACGWPEGLAEDTLRIQRRGTALQVFRGTDARVCTVSPGRHALALEGPLAEQSTIRSLEILRR